MERKNIKKIISKTILFLFIMLSFQIAHPSYVSAENKINWDNPNKNGNNPYKYNPLKSINSSMLMQVVGCTGIVDKVAGAISGLGANIAGKITGQGDLINMSGSLNKLNSLTGSKLSNIDYINTKEFKAAKEKICLKMKGVAVTSSGYVPQVTLPDGVKMVIDCSEKLATSDSVANENSKKEQAAQLASKNREECLNGIATTLAKNQLTAMTRYTMQWVTSGFNGDPMYIRDINLFMNSLTDLATQKEIDLIKNDKSGSYPYGADYARSLANSPSLGNAPLVQDLTNFLYTGEVDTTNTNQQVTNKIQTFAENFSNGGWQGWLGLTQHNANNPIGYTIDATNNLGYKKSLTEKNVREEYNRNGGVLDQKICKKYALTKDMGENSIEKLSQKYDQANKDYIEAQQKAGRLQNTLSVAIVLLENCKKDITKNCDAQQISKDKAEVAHESAISDLADKTSTLNKVRIAYNSGNDSSLTEKGECIQWEVVTPGSLIKDKVSNYLNSDTRQLELAKTINDSLNAVFSVLLSNLQDQGLTSLGDFKYQGNTSGGIGSNTTSDTIDENGNIIRSSSGFSGPFDITKELGNTFIHTNPVYLGEWNANTNIPRLYPNTGQTDTYYKVSVAGESKLINNGYNGWEVGDRAYFNGTEWQNWKADKIDKKTGKLLKTNPIDNRGIIQIQKDYLIAANEAGKVLPQVMPKFGKLDYCIPGPNPAWITNIGEANTSFTDYAYSLSANEKTESSFFDTDKDYWTIAQPGSEIYEKYHSIFGDTGLWKQITETTIWKNLKALSQISSKYKDGIWKNEGIGNNDVRSRIRNYVNSYLDDVSKEIENWKINYLNFIQSKYIDKIKNPYIANEATTKLASNDEYIPVAGAALDLTSTMVDTDSNILVELQKYRSDSINAETNIRKLDLIKDEVSLIIKDAQRRRDEALLKDLNDLNSNNNSQMTMEEYKTKYANCLAEENIKFYEDTDILLTSERSENSKERCSDGIDNDGNGMIDNNDPACRESSFYKIMGSINSYATAKEACGKSHDRTYTHKSGTPFAITNDTIYNEDGKTPLNGNSRWFNFYYYSSNNGGGFNVPYVVKVNNNGITEEIKEANNCNSIN